MQQEDEATVQAAEEAAEEEEASSIDYDALPFNCPAYWDHFYEADEDLDFYEW